MWLSGKSSKDALFKLEEKYSEKQRKRFRHYTIPSFDLGLEYFGIDKRFLGTELSEQLESYVSDWFKNPDVYLKLKSESEVYQDGNFLCFPSVLNKEQTVRFKYHAQPAGTPGREVALIHVMQWNGRLTAYERIIKFIRSTAFPISTLIHIPAGRGLNPGEGDPVDYAAVSPNIGLTVWQARQDIHDLQMMAKHLKEKLGYKQVGLFSYSLGSLRSIIASVVNPGLFDFGVFHLVGDDYTEALMNGVGTHHIAQVIRGNIDYKMLKRIWSTISPGAYQNHFTHLPLAIRVVQAQYDFTFGQDNTKSFNDKIKKEKPEAEIEEVPVGHTTLGTIPIGAGVMWRDIKFIYNNTNMKKYKRSKLFLP